MKIFDESISLIRKIADKNPQIIAGYLFGSYSTGKQRAGSDIDLGFNCFDKSGVNLTAFTLAVSNLFSRKDTDITVTDLTEKPIVLIEMINGKVIYQKNSTDRTLLSFPISAVFYYPLFISLSSRPRSKLRPSGGIFQLIC